MYRSVQCNKTCPHLVYGIHLSDWTNEPSQSLYTILRILGALSIMDLEVFPHNHKHQFISLKRGYNETNYSLAILVRLTYYMWSRA